MKGCNKIIKYLSSWTKTEIVISLVIFFMCIFAIYSSTHNIIDKTNEQLEISQSIKNEPIGEITKGIEVGQSFLCKSDNLSEIDIQFATYARKNSGTIKFVLKEEGKAEPIS